MEIARSVYLGHALDLEVWEEVAGLELAVAVSQQILPKQVRCFAFRLPNAAGPASGETDWYL